MPKAVVASRAAKGGSGTIQLDVPRDVMLTMSHASRTEHRN